MKRLNKGRDSIELYESIENLKKVKEKYFEAFELLGGKEKISIINGSRSEKEISNDIWNEISKLVGSDSHHMENSIK
jgi:dTMP kinase